MRLVPPERGPRTGAADTGGTLSRPRRAAGPLVVAASRPGGRLRPLLPRLRDPGRGARRVRRPREPGRPADDARPLPPRRAQSRPDREEAVLPRPPRDPGALARDRRLQLPLPLVPELGDLAVAPGGDPRTDADARGDRRARPEEGGSPRRLHLLGADGLRRVRPRPRRRGAEGGAEDGRRLERLDPRGAAPRTLPGPRRLQGRPEGLVGEDLPRDVQRRAEARSSTRSGGSRRRSSGPRSSRSSSRRSTTPTPRSAPSRAS